MKKYLLAICVSMAVVMMVAPAFATELWDPHLRGVNEGLAAGALPPAGFYFINDSYFAPAYHSYGDDGHADSNVKLFAYVDVPILLWVPGCKFLGADYGVAVAQPFDYTNLRIQTAGGASGAPGPNSFLGGAQWGTFNTLVVPYILSWKLPCDWRIKTSFTIAADDAWTSPKDRVVGSRAQADGGIYAESGNGTWFFEPSIGISWLHAGWNFSAEFFYAFNTKDGHNDYQSGDQFAADYTITYTWKKWTFGLGACEENQISNDKSGGVSIPGSKAEAYTMGPILGYNFGPCSLQMQYNFPLSTKNDVGGEWFNVRLVVPLGKLGL